MKFLCAAPTCRQSYQYEHESRARWTHLGVVVRREHLINTLLAQQVVLQLVRILTAPRRRRRIHPFQLIRPLSPRLLLLHPLELLQLPFLLLLLAQMVQLLLFLELPDIESVMTRMTGMEGRLTAFFSSSHTRS